LNLLASIVAVALRLKPCILAKALLAGRIVDEYNHELTPVEFKRFVDAKQANPELLSHYNIAFGLATNGRERNYLAIRPKYLLNDPLKDKHFKDPEGYEFAEYEFS
jgi:hypothetical protein